MPRWRRSRRLPKPLAEWLPKIRSRDYDSRFIPFWEKAAVTLGMGMTEKQGGTDVRANTTRAEPRPGRIRAYRPQMVHVGAHVRCLPGARPGAGRPDLLPRPTLPAATAHSTRLRLQRLKDKLGNRSNASSEVEFDDAFAWRIGEEGRGVRTIIEMVQLTRLDCAVASAGLVRMGLALAVHHARHRACSRRS